MSVRDEARSERTLLVAAATRLLVITIAWNAVGGVATLVAGLVSGSLSLGGFGANTIIDTAASAVLLVGFRAEIRDRARRSERRIALAIAVAMVSVGASLVAGSVRALRNGPPAPDPSTVGLVLLAASIAILPSIAVGKVRAAKQLESAGLRGDGMLTAASAALAAIALAGAAMDRAWGWWWADPVAALAIASFLLGAGANGVRRLRGSERGRPPS